MKRQSMSDEEMKNKDQMDNENDSTEEEGMEDEKKACGTKKSQDITEDDLQKAIEGLEGFVKSSDPVTRKEQLLKKALTEDLTNEEMGELYKAMGNSSNSVDEEENDTYETIAKSLEENDVIQKSLDVSDYLTELHGTLSKALTDLSNEVGESSVRQNQFNLMLAKGMTSIGKVVMSLQKSFSTFENTPVRKPTSVQPLKKSFAGEPEKGEQLTKSEVMGSLLEMAQSGVDKIAGFDISRAVAQIEASNQVHPAILNAIKDRKNATA